MPFFAKGKKKAMPRLAREIVKRSDIAKGGEIFDTGLSVAMPFRPYSTMRE